MWRSRWRLHIIFSAFAAICKATLNQADREFNNKRQFDVENTSPKVSERNFKPDDSTIVQQSHLNPQKTGSKPPITTKIMLRARRQLVFDARRKRKNDKKAKRRTRIKAWKRFRYRTVLPKYRKHKKSTGRRPTKPWKRFRCRTVLPKCTCPRAKPKCVCQTCATTCMCFRPTQTPCMWTNTKKCFKWHCFGWTTENTECVPPRRKYQEELQYMTNCCRSRVAENTECVSLDHLSCNPFRVSTCCGWRTMDEDCVTFRSPLPTPTPCCGGQPADAPAQKLIHSVRSTPTTTSVPTGVKNPGTNTVAPAQNLIRSFPFTKSVPTFQKSTTSPTLKTTTQTKTPQTSSSNKLKLRADPKLSPNNITTLPNSAITDNPLKSIYKTIEAMVNKYVQKYS